MAASQHVFIDLRKFVLYFRVCSVLTLPLSLEQWFFTFDWPGDFYQWMWFLHKWYEGLLVQKSCWGGKGLSPYAVFSIDQLTSVNYSFYNSFLFLNLNFSSSKIIFVSFHRLHVYMCNNDERTFVKQTGLKRFTPFISLILSGRVC